MIKTFLVGRREYFDNLRTKAFWLGISLFPVILTLSILIPSWLEKKQVLRRYAVVDRSGWLLEAVERRADLPDFEKVLRMIRDEYSKQRELLKKLLPDALFEKADELAGVDDAQIRMAAEFLAATPDSLPSGSVPKFLLGEGFEKLEELQGSRELQELHRVVREWWKGLPPDEAKKFAPDLSKSRYVRIEAEGDFEAVTADLNGLLARDEIFAYFVIGDDPLRGDEDFRYVSNNLTDHGLSSWFTRLANEEVQSRRLEEEKIAQAVIDRVQKPLYFHSRKVSAEGEEEEVEKQDRVSQIAPLVFTYILWFSIFSIVQLLLTNTIEEKSNRVIEVLLSSVSPGELMTGKILGLALTGLTVVASWFIWAVVVIKSLPLFVDSMPDIDLMAILSDPFYVASFLFYFLFGYLFYAAIFVGLGSVCNSLKEAQNLQLPIMIVMIVPLLSMMQVTKDPGGDFAKILSYIPPFTPFVMVNRAAGPPETYEYVLTSIVLLASIALAFWFAGRVFRVGIWMTGKPPRAGEILRMLVKGN